MSSVTISIPGTSISKTIDSGEYGYNNVTATLDIPSGMANSIKAIKVVCQSQGVDPAVQLMDLMVAAEENTNEKPRN